MSIGFWNLHQENWTRFQVFRLLLLKLLQKTSFRSRLLHYLLLYHRHSIVFIELIFLRYFYVTEAGETSSYL